MTGQPTLLVATGNPGKLREYQELLGDTPFRLVSLREVGITEEVEETGDTLAENAWLKASGYAQISGMLTLADDSGLEVDALGGEPGVRSARYGGDACRSDGERVALLLLNLDGVPWEKRTAQFRCVINVVRPPSWRQRAVGTAGLGSWIGGRNGTIRASRRGRIRLRPRGLSALFPTHRGPAIAGRKEPHQPPRLRRRPSDGCLDQAPCGLL